MYDKHADCRRDELDAARARACWAMAINVSDASRVIDPDAFWSTYDLLMAPTAQPLAKSLKDEALAFVASIDAASPPELKEAVRELRSFMRDYGNRGSQRRIAMELKDILTGVLQS